MSSSPDFGLPLIPSPPPAQAELLMNQSMVGMQALLRGAKSRASGTPPVSPAEGDVYIVGGSPTGAWSGRANSVAVRFGGGWRFIPGEDGAGTPIAMGARHEGMRLWVSDENLAVVFDGSAWVEQSGGAATLYTPLAANYTTWQNQGSSSSANTVFGMQLNFATIADPQSRAVYNNSSFTGSTTWEACQVGEIPSVNFSNYGLMLRDSVSGRSVGFKFGYANGVPSWVWDTWNSMTSRNSVAVIQNGAPKWDWRRFRIGGSTLHFEVSQDGKSWLELLNTGLNAWLTNSPDQAGFYSGSIPTAAQSCIVRSARMY